LRGEPNSKKGGYLRGKREKRGKPLTSSPRRRRKNILYY
jgi:hypothetical protein